MAEPITTVAALKDWAPTKDVLKDPVLLRCIDAASSLIERWTSRVIVSPAAQVTRFYDGDGLRIGGAGREVLHLKERIQDPGAMVVKENDVTLVVAQGYTTTADVVVQDAARGILRRRAGQTSGQILLNADRSRTYGWLPGVQNLEVRFTPGFGTIPPADLEQAGIELAWILFKGRYSVGKSSSARAGHSVSYLNRLSDESRAAIDRYRMR